MPEKKEEQLGRRLREITGDIKLYVEKRLELLFLNVGEHFSRVMAESVYKISGLILVGGAVIFMLVALAIYLGELLDSRSLGYLIVSVPLLATGLLFYYLKPKSFLNRLQNHFEQELVNALPSNGKDREVKADLPEHKEEQK